jgi:methionyl-tRNA formyltransferase
MRVVFFGSPEFALPSLQMLVDHGHEVLAVVTQPDKPAGRGQRMTAPPVKGLAEKLGIPVVQPKSVRTPEFAEALRALAPDAAVVVAYGKILPKGVLDIPKYGCLNVHASLLPRYRGAAPIQWALIRGELKTGVSIMLLDEGMDTGPVISMSDVDILEDDDAVSLSNMLSMMGADEMRKVLATLERDGNLDAIPQDDAQATTAPMIKREDARVVWTNHADQIILAIRGFLPWPKAYSVANDREVKFLAAEACDSDWVVVEALDDERVPPGTVIDSLKGRGIVVKAGARSLVLVTRLQPQDKPAMAAIDALNGGLIRIGTRFL